MDPTGLEKRLAQRLADRESRSQRRRLVSFPPESVDFSSNSYLSLSLVPEVRKAYLAHLEAVPASLPLFGSGGSRLLDGNLPLASGLETQVAAFHGAETGLLFNSGFDANVGLFGCLPQPGDIIVYDELVHASVHDGMKVSQAARKIPFKHNRVFGHGGLDEVLKTLVEGSTDEKVRNGARNVFVSVEGVYSMDGDVSPLEDIVKSIQKRLPSGNGYLVVDEAHSTGLFGKHGRGLVCELGLESQVFARLHTFGKAMGASGAMILCSAVTRRYLINYARTLIYTTALPLTSLASIQAAYAYLASGQAEELRAHLHRLVKYAHSQFVAISQRQTQAAAAATAPGLLGVDPGVPQSPIIPLLTRRPRSLASYCQERGFIVRPIVAPTVPKGSERVRVCLHAANSQDQVDGLCQAIESWLRCESAKESESAPARKASL